jgi:hypothetical protein
MAPPKGAGKGACVLRRTGKLQTLTPVLPLWPSWRRSPTRLTRALLRPMRAAALRHALQRSALAMQRLLVTLTQTL